MAKLSTIRSNVSHLRKMLERVRSMKVVAPPKKYTPTVRRQGSRLIIDGKKYTPADLEKLIKTKESAAWRAHAVSYLEQKLAEEEYRLVRRAKIEGRKVKKVSILSDIEKEHAESNLKFITSEEELAFSLWVERGSSGIKSHYYYHKYGADNINRGDIRGFLQYMSMETGLEITEVKDLYGIFTD